jgi:hypothetical protein
MPCVIRRCGGAVVSDKRPLCILHLHKASTCEGCHQWFLNTSLNGTNHRCSKCFDRKFCTQPGGMYGSKTNDCSSARSVQDVANQFAFYKRAATPTSSSSDDDEEEYEDEDDHKKKKKDPSPQTSGKRKWRDFLDKTREKKTNSLSNEQSKKDSTEEPEPTSTDQQEDADSQPPKRRKRRVIREDDDDEASPSESSSAATATNTASSMANEDEGEQEMIFEPIANAKNADNENERDRIIHQAIMVPTQ